MRQLQKTHHPSQRHRHLNQSRHTQTSKETHRKQNTQLHLSLVANVFLEGKGEQNAAKATEGKRHRHILAQLRRILHVGIVGSQPKHHQRIHRIIVKSTNHHPKDGSHRNTKHHLRSRHNTKFYLLGKSYQRHIYYKTSKQRETTQLKRKQQETSKDFISSSFAFSLNHSQMALQYLCLEMQTSLKEDSSF